MTVRTTTVDVPTGDGAADAVLVMPAEGGPFPGVLLYTDAFGLRPRIEQMAARIADEGYVVLAPNVFYRAGRAPLIDLDGLDQPDVRARLFGTLGPIMHAHIPDRAMRDADAYLAFLAADPQVTDGLIGTVGYCMGGALALRTAAHFAARVAAAASVHGGRLATDRPDSPHLLADRIEAEVYLGHADNDAAITPEQQRLLSDALTAAGVRFVSEVYEGAAHGFTMADTAAYDEEAESRHWERLLDLFDRTLSWPEHAVRGAPKGARLDLAP